MGFSISDVLRSWQSCFCRKCLLISLISLFSEILKVFTETPGIQIVILEEADSFLKSGIFALGFFFFQRSLIWRKWGLLVGQFGISRFEVIESSDFMNEGDFIMKNLYFSTSNYEWTQQKQFYLCAFHLLYWNVAQEYFAIKHSHWHIF